MHGRKEMLEKLFLPNLNNLVTVVWKKGVANSQSLVSGLPSHEDPSFSGSLMIVLYCDPSLSQSLHVDKRQSTVKRYRK